MCFQQKGHVVFRNKQNYYITRIIPLFIVSVTRNVMLMCICHMCHSIVVLWRKHNCCDVYHSININSSKTTKNVNLRGMTNMRKIEKMLKRKIEFYRQRRLSTTCWIFYTRYSVINCYYKMFMSYNFFTQK